MYRFSILVVFSFAALLLNAQRIATIEVELTQSSQGLEIPMHVDLDPITHVYDTLLMFTEIMAGKKVSVPYQIDRSNGRQMVWMCRAGNKGEKRVYEISKEAHPALTPSMKVLNKDGGYIIQAEDKPLLQFQHETVLAPAGVDPAFQRSGFIHPLWTPHGQILTRVQPPDHYHHYGIWNPWTHVFFEGDTIDFWNLGKKEGTVRFANLIAVSNGNVFGGVSVLQEHVVLKGGKEKVALKETQSIRIYRPDIPQDYYIADIQIHYSTVTPSPFKILEYRYAGLGWRTTGEWDNKNSSVLSSEGKTRKDADGSKAKWFIIQGKLGSEKGGAAWLSFPTNYNHPEPLRIWPENQYDRGDMFGCFCTTKDTDWLLTYGHDYVLNYRMVVFNGEFTKDQAEAAWQAYAQLPKITIRKEK